MSPLSVPGCTGSVTHLKKSIARNTPRTARKMKTTTSLKVITTNDERQISLSHSVSFHSAQLVQTSGIMYVMEQINSMTVKRKKARKKPIVSHTTRHLLDRAWNFFSHLELCSSQQKYKVSMISRPGILRQRKPQKKMKVVKECGAPTPSHVRAFENPRIPVCDTHVCTLRSISSSLQGSICSWYTT